MLAIHDQFTRDIHSRLKTIGMGLGLVRLLQDAGRIDEASGALSMLEDAFPGLAEELQSDSRSGLSGSKSLCTFL